MKKKLRFLKDHVNGIKKGDVGDFSEGRANYLIRTGVAELVEQEEPKKVDSKKDEPKRAVAPKGKNVKQEEPCKTC
jgi:hypothetical protein